MRSAIHQISHSVEHPAGYADQRLVRIVLGGSKKPDEWDCPISGGDRNGPSGHRYELSDLAAIERQIDDLLLIDHLADAGAVRFHHRRRGLHLDLFADRADPQDRVDRGRRVDLQHDAALNICTEAFLLDLHSVRPDGKARQRVGTGGTALCGPGQPGVGLCNSDLSSRDSQAAGVLNGPRDLGHGLSKQSHTRQCLNEQPGRGAPHKTSSACRTLSPTSESVKRHCVAVWHALLAFDLSGPIST